MHGITHGTNAALDILIHDMDLHDLLAVVQRQGRKIGFGKVVIQWIVIGGALEDVRCWNHQIALVAISHSGFS